MLEEERLSSPTRRTELVRDLRRLLPGAEAGRQTLRLGLPAVDSHLPEGGLAAGALHEIVPEAQAALPAAFGFIAALLACLFSPRPERGKVRLGASGIDLTPPRHASRVGPPGAGNVVFVLPAYGRRWHGRLHGRGLRGLGLDPLRLILVETAQRKDTLWALAEALRSAAPLAVAGHIDRLDLKMSQRLQLAAGEASLPLLLLRPAQTLEASAASTRWRIGPALAGRDRFGLFARPRWHLRLERCRNGRPGEWVVEYDHVAHRFSLAAALADPALSGRAGGQPFRQAG